MKHTSVDELTGLLKTAAQSPSQAATVADMVSDMVRGLPPERAELASRAQFHLGTDTMLQASFEDLPASSGQGETSPFVLEMPYDCWIRGMVASAIIQVPGALTEGEQLPDVGAFLALQGLMKVISIDLGSLGRWSFEASWRLNDRQGFLSRGAGGEVLANATCVLGTGEYPAAADWRLQKDETIEVRVRNAFNELFVPIIPGGITELPIRLLTVGFLALRLPLRAPVPRRTSYR